MQRLFTTKILFTVVALSVGSSRLQMQAFAQVNQPSQKLLADSSNGRDANAATGASSSTTVNTTNAEVIKELQQMRARIAELEAQLKAQQGDAPALVNTTITTVQPGDRGREQFSRDFDTSRAAGRRARFQSGTAKAWPSRFWRGRFSGKGHAEGQDGSDSERTEPRQTCGNDR
jgi:hypothetical protein